MELWSWIICGVISVFAILGNGAVVLIVATRRRLHTAANWFVLSLAVADLMFGLSFLTVEKIVEIFPGNFAYHAPSLIFGAASVTNLVVMTLDRYVRVVHPLRYTSFVRTKQVVILISTAWLLALIRPLLQLHKYKQKAPEALIQAAKIADLLLFQLTPCVLLFLATAKIFLIVRRQRKRQTKLDLQLRFNYPGEVCSKPKVRSSKLAKSTPTRESVSAKVIATAVVFFLLTFGLRLILHFFQKHPSKKTMVKIFHVLVITNSAVNPIAYAFFTTDIRRELQLVFRSLRRHLT